MNLLLSTVVFLSLLATVHGFLAGLILWPSRANGNNNAQHRGEVAENVPQHPDIEKQFFGGGDVDENSEDPFEKGLGEGKKNFWSGIGVTQYPKPPKTKKPTKGTKATKPPTATPQAPTQPPVTKHVSRTQPPTKPTMHPTVAPTLPPSVHPENPVPMPSEYQGMMDRSSGSMSRTFLGEGGSQIQEVLTQVIVDGAVEILRSYFDYAQGSYLGGGMVEQNYWDENVNAGGWSEGDAAGGEAGFISENNDYEWEGIINF